MITDKTLYIKEGHVSGDEWDDTRPATATEIMRAAEKLGLLIPLEERVKSLEDWRNRTIWGFQAQTLQGKTIETMTIWELIMWASQVYNAKGVVVDIRFREQAVDEIERRIAEAAKGGEK